MTKLVDFLLENNYADSEKAASKILEAASDEFKDYILQEMNQQQHDSLKRRIANARTQEEKQRLQAQLDQLTQEQRQKILKPKVKSVIRSSISKTVSNSTPAKAVKRFVKYTALGGLAL